MVDQSRRSFLRVALLGVAGAATVVACPQFIEALLTRKSYFFLGEGPGVEFVRWKLAEAAERIGEMMMQDLYLCGQCEVPEIPFDSLVSPFEKKLRRAQEALPEMKLDEAFHPKNLYASVRIFNE